jgi:hypothetical protein
MGEAKRNQEALRAKLIKNISEWSFPPSEWEAKMVSEISKLPVVMVARAPEEQLEWARMKAKECHANARFMAENDPAKQTRQVLGWWPQEGNFVLHSVIQQGDQMICVTPSPFNSENPFPFMPDPEIEAREENDHLVYYRKGQKIGPGFRSDPHEAIRLGLETKKRLEAGGNPYDAFRVYL